MASDNYDFQPFLIPVKPLIQALCEILPQIGTIELVIFSIGIQIQIDIAYALIPSLKIPFAWRVRC